MSDAVGRRARYITSPRYEVDIGPHVFPTCKYRLIRDRLLSGGEARPEDLVEPELASDEALLRVHDAEYVRKVRTGTLSPAEQLRLELPWSRALAAASARCVQGSIMAARDALERGAGLHVGGGFHHAFPGHGEGFCVFNDVACAIRAVQASSTIRRAVVVDCDLHQGNGTAAIFAQDRDVGTFSIHQQDIYPFPKPPSDVDVGIDAGTGDTEYLERLDGALLPFLGMWQPELVFYLAGADPYAHDQLGALRLTKDGLTRRDGLVVEACRRIGAPVAVVLAGGYARDIADTVQVHLSSLRQVRVLVR